MKPVSFVFTLGLVILLILSCNGKQSYKYVKHNYKLDTINLVFVGDIMVHTPQIKAAKVNDSTYSFIKSFQIVKPIISSADIAFANLETTFSGKPYRGYPQFSSPDELLEAIYDAGFDVLTTANNHCNDRGNKGICRTIDIIKSKKIKTTGTYKNYKDSLDRSFIVLNKKGLKIGVIAYTYGTNGLKVKYPTKVDIIDTISISNKIRIMRDSLSVNYIIAIMHWGHEYQREPNNYQKNFAKWLNSKGVDAIVGSHPHVVQRSTFIIGDNGHKSYCIYSLGNFISNQNTPVGTRGGIILNLRLTIDNKKNNIVTKPTYRFVWLQKRDNNNKYIYKILPIHLNVNADTIDYMLNNKEKQELNKFCEYYKSIDFVEIQ